MTQRIKRCLRLSAKKQEPDGEIVFLAADPGCKVKGVGTALLSAFEAEETGNWFISTPTMPAPISFMNTEDLQNRK